MPEALNQCAGPFGAAYDFYIERPRLMQALGRLLWGVDLSSLYASIDATIGRSSKTAATVIDSPCGGGVAFRALRQTKSPLHRGRSLAEDARARARRARARSLAQVEFVEADMLALPFADGQADVFIVLQRPAHGRRATSSGAARSRDA